MKRQVGLVRTRVLSLLLSSAALVLTGAMAQAASMPVKATAQPAPFWWFHGSAEVGGRFFINDPLRDGAVYNGQRSLAKYYEYTDVKPGAFGNFGVSAGTSDGLYEIDAGGKNVGYDDQSYYLEFSQAGTLYINGAYDQTPHTYSTSAQTPYNGVGTNSLTLPSGFLGTGAMSAARLGQYSHGTDIGIRRDTASGDLRWTPSEPWDIRADYSHMHRHGTQIDGVVGMFPTGMGFPVGPTEVPRPVDDTTQNYGLNGEYAGTSPWGQSFSFKLAYSGSTYTDAFTSYTVQNPFCVGGVCAASALTGGGVPYMVQSPFARLATWPSNHMNAFSGTLGADLPWKSRYVGHVSYTMMRQNDTFIPMSNNPSAPAYTLPQSSLNGAINTFLSDNVITTQLTSDLTSKLSYRYYDFRNNTPELQFASPQDLDGTGCFEGGCETLNTLTMAYIKQNLGAALNWRPSRHWNIGAAYGWQRYDWTRADANATNENSGKVHVDWTPTSWFTVRSSGYYASRRYDNYDYYGYVCDFNFNANCLVDQKGYSAAYRQFFLDNRDRSKVNIGADLVVTPGLTVSPSFKYQDDNYGLDPKTEEGLRDSKSYSAGVDVTYLVNPDTSISVGYLYENGAQLVYNCSCGGHQHNADLPINNPSKFMETNDRIEVNTFHALARYAAIPQVLDLALRYTVSRGTDHQQVLGINGTNYGFNPDDTTWYQRLDATAVYTFNKQMVRQMGWKGKVKAKLHYAWERSSVSNWQNDTLAPYGSTSSYGAFTGIFMGWDNPNYNVHMLMGSLVFKW